MRSIQRRFNNFQGKNPDLSSYTNFAKAVKGQCFSKGMISRWFTRLVEKSDYERKDRKHLIENLTEFTTLCKDNRK